jgi:enoyl-CoA hydratase/carnithine racemase
MTESSSRRDLPLVLLRRTGPVAVVTLNRPEVQSALSFALMEALAQTVSDLDRDPEVRVIVLAVAGGVFAAGADIGELLGASPADLMREDRLAPGRSLRATRRPIVAAVEGLALGGGMELAMLADLIVAGEGARF